MEPHGLVGQQPQQREQPLGRGRVGAREQRLDGRPVLIAPPELSTVWPTRVSSGPGRGFCYMVVEGSSPSVAYVALGSAQGGGSGAAAVPIELVRVEHLRRACRRLRVAPERCAAVAAWTKAHAAAARGTCA